MCVGGVSRMLVRGIRGVRYITLRTVRSLHLSETFGLKIAQSSIPARGAGQPSIAAALFHLRLSMSEYDGLPHSGGGGGKGVASVISTCVLWAGGGMRTFVRS